MERSSEKEMKTKKMNFFQILSITNRNQVVRRNFRNFSKQDQRNEARGRRFFVDKDNLKCSRVTI